MMWVKKAKTIPLMTTLTKIPKPKVKKCFFSLRIQKLAKSFEDLNSSLAQSAEKPSCKVMWKLLCQAENTGS